MSSSGNLDSTPAYIDEYLPERVWDGLWVGSSNPYAPGLTVERGPTLSDLRTAYKNHASVVLYLTYRTADMTDDDPDEEIGEVAVGITDLFDTDEDGKPHNVAYFLGEAAGSRDSFLHDATLWVWDYDGQFGFADFYVT